MSREQMVALIVALVLGVAGYAAWYAQRHPREIVGTGLVEVRSERAGGQTLSLRTRDVAINGATFQEVELPNGTWIACSGDCVKAVREAGDGFWDKQQRDHR
jgi:hypothetical protein